LYYGKAEALAASSLSRGHAMTQLLNHAVYVDTSNPDDIRLVQPIPQTKKQKLLIPITDSKDFTTSATINTQWRMLFM
jgi:hypothetical protein